MKSLPRLQSEPDFFEAYSIVEMTGNISPNLVLAEMVIPEDDMVLVQQKLSMYHIFSEKSMVKCLYYI